MAFAKPITKLFHFQKGVNYLLSSAVYFILFLSNNATQAQVSVYTFSESLTGYAPLVGTPTVAYAAPWDDHTAGAAAQVTLPFSFVFDGISYSQLYISPNGFISFGALEPAINNYAPISSATAQGGIASALGINLVSNGSPIVYDIIGVAPNRTVVVQWTNAVRALDAGDFNFQIRLNEGSNVIDFSYGLCTPNGTINRPVQVGLRGGTNVSAQGNINNRQQGSATNWFSNTGNFGLNASTLNTQGTLVPTVAVAYPDLGLNFKYTPALPCVTPSASPSTLVVGGTSITSTSFVGNTFVAAAPTSTNYLILRSLVNTPPSAAQVVNRTYYSVASVIAGVYYVVGNSNALTFNQTGLAPSTTYYYWVLSYNDKCTGAPFYNLTSIASANAATCATPTVASLGSVAGNSFVVNWSVVPTATNYVIDVATNATFTTFVSGYSNLSLGLVTTLNVSGLLPQTTYYIRVRAIGSGGCILNSNTVTTTTTCGFYTIPYVQNFDSFPVGVVPTCFNRSDVNADGIQWQTQSINFSSASRSMHLANSATQNANDWLFMPGLSLTGGVSYRLFFRYNTGNTAAFYENLRVQLGTGASVVAMTETLLDLPNLNNTAFQIAIVDFVPVTSGIYYVGFQGYSVANQTYLVLDDVSVTLSPNCFEPTDVVIDTVANTTATVTWTASVPAPANGYQYYLSTSPTVPNGATVPTGAVPTGITTLNLSGLLPSTYYYIWIRGNCSAVDKSVWTLEESFSTECSTPSIVTTIPSTRCGTGTTVLSATSSVGSTITWYASASGGTAIAAGNNFTTPVISAASTYYLEAKSFGALAKVAPINPINEGGILATQNFIGGVYFSASSATSLQSIDVFPLVSGQIGQITIRNTSNVTLATFNFTTTVSGGATPQVITINFPLEIGNYNLYLSTVPTSGLRMNVTNAVYPYSTSVADITGNTFDSTAFLGFYNWKFTTQCISARVPITASVSPPPALTLSASSSIICETFSTPVITVSGYAAYNTLVWSPNTGISGNFSTGFTFNPTVTTTYSLLANQTSGSFCGNIITHTVIVNPQPASIMVVPSAATLCENTIQALNGSSGTSSAVPIFTENFNGATNSWTVENTSIGGATAASQWTLRPDNYNYINGFGWNVTFHSNDNSQFYLANSDSQSAIPGIITRTTLTSPSFSLVGYTSASLNFSHYIRYISNDIITVQVSTDNGATWAVAKTYIATVGTAAVFANDTVNLSPYLGNPDVKLRFSFSSEWGYVWAVDSVVVSATLGAALTWTPTTGLYTDAAATIPYTSGSPITVVFAKPATTTTYTATITGSNGCTRSSNTTLTVIPISVGGTVSSDQTICSSATPMSLLLTGNVGTVQRWEYADDAAFTVNLTPITTTSTTLLPAQMGSFSTIRYFRAVIKSGFCNPATSNGVYVFYPSTTWNGTTWSNGTPSTSVKAIFAGNYTSTGNITACSILVNSGVVTVNSNHSFIVDDEVVVNGGSLVFENNSSLLQINNTVNVGNIVYKRSTMPMKKFDYTYWSAPVFPQTLVALSPFSPSDKYFKFDPIIANWTAVAAINLMDQGKGYIIRAPFTFDPTVPAVYNGVFSGIPNNGTITTPIVVSTSNFNLIGNPYPSAVNADLFLSDTANSSIIDATLYFWTHNTPITANQYTSNDYAVYNYLGGTGTSSAPNVGGNANIPNGKIASGQSFFVKGLLNGVATFKNSMRMVGNNDQFFKLSSPATTASFLDFEKHRIWLDVVNAQGNYKQTLIGYAAQATAGIDRGFDGAFFNVGNALNLYSISNETTLSIQGRPLPFIDTDEVVLGFTTATSGSFTINLYNFDGLFLNQDIYLKDNVLNVLHNLKLSSYSFLSQAGTFSERFTLVYRDSTLNTAAFSIEDNTIVLYKPNDNLHIKTSGIIMESVKVYDVRGSLLQEKKAINATETAFNLGSSNQVLLLQITTSDGTIINRKYVN